MAREILELSLRNAGAIMENMEAFEERAAQAIQRLVQQYGEATKARVAQLAPRLTGRMAEKVRTHYGNTGFSWEVGWDASDFLGEGLAFYPFFQEFGTKYMSAQPSLRPAYDEMAPRFSEDLRSLLQRLATQPLSTFDAGANRFREVGTGRFLSRDV